jgi:hypothetical protein
MEMFWVMFIFFAFVTAVFVVISFIFPEWIGITGKKALEIQKHQQGEDEGSKK